MSNITSIVKNIRNIMRQDRGVSGDAQRLEQLGWLLFLKILDDKDQELELIRDGYNSVLPEKFQWRNWATDPEGITGPELMIFIDHPLNGLFATLKSLHVPEAPLRAMLVREVFDGSNNYMKSGYELRKVISSTVLTSTTATTATSSALFTSRFSSSCETLATRASTTPLALSRSS